jgi:hypothetical protein
MNGYKLHQDLAYRGVVSSPRNIFDDDQAQYPSHILQAMQVGEDRIMGQVRFTLGKQSKPEDIDLLLRHLAKIMEQYWKAENE